MKTPAVKSGAEHIVVEPTQDRVVPASAPGQLSDAEAWQIVRAIRPRFAEYVARYDTKKYWPDVYQHVRRAFRQPEKVASDTLRNALLWKYGHLGKPGISPSPRGTDLTAAARRLLRPLLSLELSRTRLLLSTGISEERHASSPSHFCCISCTPRKCQLSISTTFVQ